MPAQSPPGVPVPLTMPQLLWGSDDILSLPVASNPMLPSQIYQALLWTVSLY